MKYGNVLIGVFVERDINESESVEPPLTVLINDLKLNENDVVLELDLTLCDLRLHLLDLSDIPLLLHDSLLYQQSVLFLPFEYLVPDIRLGKGGINLCQLGDTLEFGETRGLLQKGLFLETVLTLESRGQRGGHQEILWGSRWRFRSYLYVIILVNLEDLLLLTESQCLFPLHEREPEISLELSYAHPQLLPLERFLPLEHVFDGGSDD